MSHPALTATGAVTALGADVRALWDGLLDGASRVAPTPEFLDGSAPVARVPLAPSATEDRTDALLRLAANQLQESPAWHRAAADPRRVGLCVGTTQGPVHSWQQGQHRLGLERPALPDLAAPIHRLARHLGLGGPVACPSMACASGTAAIGLALDWLREGACDAVVAGGVDALSDFVYHGFLGLRALDPERPRPFDARRAGLGLGEGAGLVLLERLDPPQRGTIRVAGRGLSADANHLTGPDPTGSGVARAINAALADAGCAAEAVDFVNAHGTATVFNDLMEAKALERVLGQRLGRVPVNSIKGAIGHTMGAAGALEAVLCAQVLRHGRIPPTAGLEQQDPAIELDVVQGAPRDGDYRCVVTTSSGFGGINAALVLQIDR